MSDNSKLPKFLHGYGENKADLERAGIDSSKYRRAPGSTKDIVTWVRIDDDEEEESDNTGRAPK